MSPKLKAHKELKAHKKCAESAIGTTKLKQKMQEKVYIKNVNS